MVEKKMSDLVAEAVKKELQPIVEKVKVISDENRTLKQRLDQVETQLRSSNLVIHGIPETTYAEAASNSMEEDHSQKPSSRVDTVRAVVNCCEARLGLKISASDITAGYRIAGPRKGPRPIVVCFANRNTRDKVLESRKLLRHHQGDAKIYINEHLTRGNSEIFAVGRKLLKEKKICSVWSRNGHIYLKRSDRDKPSRILTLEDLTRLQ